MFNIAISTLNREMKRIGSYKLLDKIGNGHYATVYLARKEGCDSLVAVKSLKREGSATTQLKNIENEVTVLMSS